MDWNGVEERYELERRKDKLVSQLEEAASLWKSINKRTGLIAGYIQQNLFYQVGPVWLLLWMSLMDVLVSFQDVVNFHHCIVQRVDQILELKELQEQIKEAEIQLKTVKHVKK